MKRDFLKTLDGRAKMMMFPMLDNGYFFPAATRLTLFRADADWGLTIEVFSYSTRGETPTTVLYTFCEPSSDMLFLEPVGKGDWQDPEEPESLANDARQVVVRGGAVELPEPAQYADHGIELTEPPRVRTFEMCRFLAAAMRERVLATPDELRAAVPPQLAQILQLDEWEHPDLVQGQLPSATETFRQLAAVVESGDVDRYRPTRPPNTHWSHWPEAGLL